MGLAASQARFLGLTARKSNVEYQGQQINQARTALSNEVMGLFKKYNSLDVPVPPSKTDFTKTVYSLENTYEDYKVASFTKIASGDYKGYYNVTLEYGDDIPKAYTKTFRDIVVTASKENNEYKYLSFQIGTDKYTYDADDEKNSEVSKITLNKIEDAKKYTGLETIINENKYNIEKNGNFYRFLKDNVYYYVWEENLPNEYSDKDDKNRGICYCDFTFDYQGIKKETKTVDTIASIEQDKSGRLSSINIIKCDDPEYKDLVGHAYPITVSTTEDESAYQDAMNKYNYEKDKYERQVELINKKTEKIQKEDRALELQLNQLDTEQNALKTEMDAIHDVIKNTIESVFKTYNS